MTAREPHSLRRRLEVTLIGVALVSVLLLGALTYGFAHVLLTDSVEAKLTTLRDARVESIERGARGLQTDVSMLALTPSVIAATEQFAAAFGDLADESDPGDPSGSLGLDEAYDAVLESLDIDVEVEDVVPTTDAGRRLQDLYIASNPYGFDERDRLDDAGDGSRYSEVHASFHPLLRTLTRNVRMSDLLLVDADTADVVYSVEKRIDVGTNAMAGPWSGVALRAVIDELSDAPIGDTVFIDSVFYPPARGEAVLFMAAAIRSGSDVVGAVITEVPVAAVTTLVTAGQDWELLGLGETGDVYLVGADSTLRTDVRRWLEDPDAFLADHEERIGDEARNDRIRQFGSPVLLQQIDNEAIDEALSGEEFLGGVTNYRGSDSLTASAPASIGSLEWVVVVEQERSETQAALRSMLWGTLLVMVVLLPITGALGLWLARSLTRPFRVIVDAAADVARGESIVGVDRLGKNEVGDVGRQLELVAAQLEAEEQAIAAEEQRIIDVLGAVMPPRLIDRVRSGEQDIDDLVDLATIISITVAGLPEAGGSDHDSVLELTEHVGDELQRLMDEHGVERLRRSASTGLFVAGLGRPDANIDGAVSFAIAVLPMLAAAGAEYGHHLAARIGVSSGEVATGVIGRSQLTFSVWGEAVSDAFALSSLAQPGEVLADGTVASELGDRWMVEECVDLPVLDDDVTAFRVTPAPST
jgi:class 3 adenylate cyclase